MNISLSIKDDQLQVIKKEARKEKWLCPGCPYYQVWCKCVLTLPQCARILGISEKTLWRYKQKKLVPFLQASPHKRILFIPHKVFKAISHSPKLN